MSRLVNPIAQISIFVSINEFPQGIVIIYWLYTSFTLINIMYNIRFLQNKSIMTSKMR